MVTCVITYKNGEEQYIDINYPQYRIIEENGWLYIIGYAIIPMKYYTIEQWSKMKRSGIPIDNNYPRIDKEHPHLVAKIRMKTMRAYRFE